MLIIVHRCSTVCNTVNNGRLSARRISETGQAVVLTLVDNAAAKLQNLAETKIDSEFSSRSPVKNSSLLSGNQIRQSEELTTKAAPSTQIPSPPIEDEATTTAAPNDTDVLNDGEDVLLLKNISAEETPEVVVIVRTDQKDELQLKAVDEEIDQVQMSEELPPKTDNAFTTAPELNDTAAREQLVGGNRDETAAVILDGLVASGPTDPHEDIPSFSEWAQKRLEEAEKKKSECYVQLFMAFYLFILYIDKFRIFFFCSDLYTHGRFSLFCSSSERLRSDPGWSRTRRKRYEDSFEELRLSRLRRQDCGG